MGITWHCLQIYMNQNVTIANFCITDSPNILKIKRHPSSHPPFLSLLSNKDDFLTCSVDANPRPEVKLERKSARGNWEELPSLPDCRSSNRTVYECRFPLWSIGKGTFRCSAYNKYGIAAPNLKIHIKCESVHEFCLEMKGPE